MSSWNRPTIGWRLSCDAEPGKTRKDGYEAAGHSFTTTSKESWIRKLGITVIVLYSVVFCIAMFAWFMMNIDFDYSWYEFRYVDTFYET